MSGRLFARRPLRIQPVAIAQIDIEPAVVVVIEEGQAASLGLNDDPLGVDAAPHVGELQASLLRYVNELDQRR
jgi:hypothetical protein